MLQVQPSSPFIEAIPLRGCGLHQPKTASLSLVARITVSPGGINCGEPGVRLE
jgi:hypothetical protein